jgi:hypothetical protein
MSSAAMTSFVGNSNQSILDEAVRKLFIGLTGLHQALPQLA